MQDSILVTGGAGYIGSHMCKALKKKGFIPITYDNLSEGDESAVKWGPLIIGDLNDSNRLNFAINTYKPIAVMHFAANALVSESVKNPGKYYQNNVANTINLLNAMVANNLKTIIFSSTCATFGLPQNTPICEQHPQKPINPYGRSKWMIEQILEDFKKAYGIESAILRYFNAAGADLDTEIGENHKTETHLIPLTIYAALNINPHITIYGNDYPTEDGTAIRDYIHVNDLADAHLRALEYLLSNKQSIKLNLGTGKGFSVLQIIEQIKEITQIDFLVKKSKKREGDPSILFANSSLAKKLLGWQPQYSDLKTIIESAWLWHKKTHAGTFYE